MQSSASSFFRFVLGFLLFISASFGVTYVVNSYATERDQAAQQAAALQAMVRMQ